MASLIEMCGWHGCKGWQGVKCSCGATYNLMVDIPGFTCERCGHFNILSWSHHQFCHRKPDYGWNRSVIGWAMKNYSWYRDSFKETSIMLKKLNKRLAS